MHAPENTLAAFELATQQGADAIELDAKLSADGHVVVIHDQTVDRTTEGSGRVKDLTLADLRQLDAGSHFDLAFKGEKIPTLEEVVEAFGSKTFINVELTNYASLHDELPEKVAELVSRHNLARKMLFSSFNPFALRRIHRRLPEVPLGLLALPGRKGALARSRVGEILVRYQAIHPELRDVSRPFLDRAHLRGYRVHVYTCNDATTMRWLFSLGVDGLFTDDPLLAHQILRAVSV